MKFHWLNRQLVKIAPPFVEKGLLLLPPRYAVKIRQKTTQVGRLDYDKANIYLNVQSLVEYDTRLHSCKKEPETVAWVESFGHDDVFFDIGANVGAYSLVAALAPGTSTKVFAFEPGAANYSQMCLNLAINNCSDKIVALPIALSNQTSIDQFNYSEVTPGAALHALGVAIDYKGEPFKPKFVQAVLSYRLDDLIEQFNLPLPNHVKIDVDGTDPAILEGAQITLTSSSMKSLLLEFNEDNEDSMNLLRIVTDMGFEVASKHKYLAGGTTGPFSRMYNYIFTKKSA